MGGVIGTNIVPDCEQLVFIAHFLHFSRKEIEEMSFSDINDWFNEGYSLWEKMKEAQVPKELKGNNNAIFK